MSGRFLDRYDAGRRLAQWLGPERADDGIVLGLARGGVLVAAEVAARLRMPLDVLTVRKVGHPLQPEYALGAVVAGGEAYLRSTDGLSEEEVRAAVASARAQADALDRRLRAGREPIDIAGRACLLVDDGLATGSTMIAAIRWARAAGARRVVAAVPVAAAQTAEVVRRLADAFVCPLEMAELWAVGAWYEDFRPAAAEEVIRLVRDGVLGGVDSRAGLADAGGGLR